jgi:heme/copper-type cytochrome/quinol oxidase subunit 2
MEARDIFTSYYFWLAIEAIVLVVLIIFVSKYSRMKKARMAELASEAENKRYSELDEKLINMKRSTK